MRQCKARDGDGAGTRGHEHERGEGLGGRVYTGEAKGGRNG